MFFKCLFLKTTWTETFLCVFVCGWIFSPSTVWPSDFIFCQFEYSNSHLSVWAIPGSCKCAVVAPVAEKLCLQWHNVCFLFGSGVGGEGLAVEKWSQTKVRCVLHIFIEVYIFFLFFVCHIMYVSMFVSVGKCCTYICSMLHVASYTSMEWVASVSFCWLLFLLEGKLSP